MDGHRGRDVIARCRAQRGHVVRIARHLKCLGVLVRCVTIKVKYRHAHKRRARQHHGYVHRRACIRQAFGLPVRALAACSERADLCKAAASSCVARGRINGAFARDAVWRGAARWEDRHTQIDVRVGCEVHLREPAVQPILTRVKRLIRTACRQDQIEAHHAIAWVQSLADICEAHHGRYRARIGSTATKVIERQISSKEVKEESG